jgi:exopolysaccharide biosynthesis polyprenyl glycosylphosphotransferase
MAVVDERRTTSVRSERSRAAEQAVWVRRHVRAAMAADFGCALVAALVALFGRFQEPFHAFLVPYQILTIALPFVWVSAIAISRGYQSRFIGLGSDEFRRVLNAGVTLTAAVAVLAYATKVDVARGYVVVALPLATFLNLAARYALRRRLHRMWSRGRCMRRVVAVGHRASVADLIRRFRREQYHGMDVVAVCLPAGRADADEIDGVPVLGDFSEAVHSVEQSEADTVAVLSCPEMDGTTLRRLAWRLEKTGTDLCVAPALMDVAGPRTTIRPVAGLPLLHVEHPELDGAGKLLKSLMDRMGAGLALVLLSPVFLLITVLIRTSGPGNVLFKQTRVGRNGREFTVLKFRTMVRDAERMKTQLTVRNDHDGVLFKIKNDPRITRVGGFLRRYSLDELPQLLNVMLGDMSLVGPRPPLPDEVAQYGFDVRRRLVVKPGMTGLWQVGGRSDLSWEESVRLDLRYVENWSLALDLQIMWKTVAAVLRGSGAY